MTPIVERFWSKVDRRAPNGCWLWLAAKSWGYGMFWIDGHYKKAHRIAYEFLRGPIPVGLKLDHFRLNPGPRNAPCSKACVNPEHLEPVTTRLNLLRGRTRAAENVAKTLCPRGHAYDVIYAGSRCCRSCQRERMRRTRPSRARRVAS